MEVCENEPFTTLPPPMNRLYYPLDVDVGNHMYQASVKQMLYKFDQQNFVKIIGNWHQEHPQDLLYLDLVPYILHILLLKFRKMKHENCVKSDFTQKLSNLCSLSGLRPL